MKTITINVPDDATNVTVNYDTPEIKETSEEYLDLMDLIKSLDDGTYNTKYKIGDTFELDLGENGIVHPVITGFHKDCIVNSSLGTAKVTLVTKDLLKNEITMNDNLKMNDDNGSYILGTGAIGGFLCSKLNNYLYYNIYGFTISDDIRSRIAEVYKSNEAYDKQGRKYTQVAPYRLWIPSYDEIKNLEHKDRIKTRKGKPDWYWLRDAYYNYGFRGVGSGGSMGGSSANVSFGVALGFCLN